MVETAAAFFRLAEIARAHPRLCALNLGAEDFATSAGIAPDAEALSTPKQTAVIAARAGGLHRLDCRVQRSRRVSLDDSPLAPLRLYRRLGHSPEQGADPERGVPAAPDEVDHARRVVAAYDKALAEGVGAVTVERKMIDVPVVERAQLLLEREAEIATREANMARLGS